MTIFLKGLLRERAIKEFISLMERAGSVTVCEHVIDINSNEASSSAPSHETNGLDPLQRDSRASNSTRVAALQTSAASTNGQNSRNSSLIRRADAPGRRRRSPLNSGLWISIELVLTVSQIVAAIVVLSLSRNEHPHAPLFAWIVGYASGCAATLPLLYWRWYYRNQSLESGASNSSQGSSQSNASTSLSNASTLRTSDASQSRLAPSQSNPPNNSNNAPRAAPSLRIPNPRVKAFVDYFKMILDCFFAVWFVVGNVWIFGGHSSSSEAPNLYRLCIVFLTFSCIGYAMPFLLCAAICCCLPCIISVLGFREDLGQNRGASSESINSLPTYKFKVKKVRSSSRELSSGMVEGGVVAAGTDKERTITGDDAVCCICLAKYANNDELRELPCSHFFHKDCVDKWLKINALCPLCKGEVGESNSNSATATV